MHQLPSLHLRLNRASHSKLSAPNFNGVFPFITSRSKLQVETRLISSIKIGAPSLLPIMKMWLHEPENRQFWTRATSAFVTEPGCNFPASLPVQVHLMCSVFIWLVSSTKLAKKKGLAGISTQEGGERKTQDNFKIFELSHATIIVTWTWECRGGIWSLACIRVPSWVFSWASEYGVHHQSTLVVLWTGSSCAVLCAVPVSNGVGVVSYAKLCRRQLNQLNANCICNLLANETAQPLLPTPRKAEITATQSETEGRRSFFIVRPILV